MSGQPLLKLPHTAECCEVQTDHHCTCPGCPAGYCSDGCLQTDRAVHRWLCTHNDADHPYAIIEAMWREFHPPPETTSIALVARICVLLLEDSSDGEFASKLQSFCHDFERGSFQHKLLSGKFDDQIEVFRTMLHSYFSHHPNFARLDNQVCSGVLRDTSL